MRKACICREMAKMNVMSKMNGFALSEFDTR